MAAVVMPDLFSFAGHGHEQDTFQDLLDEQHTLQKPVRRTSLFDRIYLKRIGNLLKRDHVGHGHEQQHDAGLLSVPTEYPQELPEASVPQDRRLSLLDRRSLNKAVPSLPRPFTFRRQQSERRDRLLQVPPSAWERRAVSADRKRGLSLGARRPPSPKPILLPPPSAPEVGNSDDTIRLSTGKGTSNGGGEDHRYPNHTKDEPSPEQPPLDAINDEDEPENVDTPDHNSLQEELDQRWILNLSMHFRDGSDREKFFVTYAEQANRWRRLTISLDYRPAPPNSLEKDVKSLHYQRDKSLRIYEAIRESMPEIKYHDTVTNLKLQTSEDGQLHVHVREDTNEIISYPPVSAVRHVACHLYREGEIGFDSHLSGFVYKVNVDNQILIKKEIPGPDTVDEFLYEVNALNQLHGSEGVIQLQGLITDDAGTIVKGLLISYARQGPLVDMLYDFKGDLSWDLRESWAKQIITGLSEIHDAGFVQGDFTLSNIVIDGDDYAKVIDINRRGCPVGWEPPEFTTLIESGQRVGMFISNKTDLFQLGMVLWALAMECDEPGREERPLPHLPNDVPLYYRMIVQSCLKPRPQDRKSAKELLAVFKPPRVMPIISTESALLQYSDHSVSTTHRSDKEYIDPDLAMTLDEVKLRPRPDTGTPHFTSGQNTRYADSPSTNYRFESAGSWVVGRSRGRSPGSRKRGRSSPFARRSSSSATSLSPTSRGRRSDFACASEIDGTEYITPEAGQEAGYMPETLGAANTMHEPNLVQHGHTEGMLLPSMGNQVFESLQSEGDYFAAPRHQDSGFDEHMVESIEAASEEIVAKVGSLRFEESPLPLSRQATQPLVNATAAIEPTTAKVASEAVEPCVSAEECSSGEPPTPGSFYTPLASPHTVVTATGTIDDTRQPN